MVRDLRGRRDGSLRNSWCEYEAGSTTTLARELRATSHRPEAGAGRNWATSGRRSPPRSAIGIPGEIAAPAQRIAALSPDGGGLAVDAN
jgi:hypothetical protein